MYFRQFYLGCLAQASYMIGSEGEAVVVDPRRDVDEYLADAEAHGLKIRYILETHLHADFVSGHRELAERTGATIVFGARAGAALPHLAVRDGDEIRVGRVALRILETPGHTPESVSVLVTDGEAPGEPPLVLTGDTLFIGDVGRPDLAGSYGHSAGEMAAMLYDSLHGKLLKLPDAAAVYPAHGAGSLCGRNISKETSSTIGHERRTNYALQPMAKEEFVRLATTDLPELPPYFGRDVAINREGARPLVDRLPPVLEPAEVAARAGSGTQLLDVRPAAAFGAGHVPGSWNIGLTGQFASWAGTLLAPQRGIVVVAEDEAAVAEAAMRLSRVGLENTTGHLARGLLSWHAAGLPVGRLPQWPVGELWARLEEDTSRSQVLDVRRPSEHTSGRVPGAVNIPLDRLERESGALDRSRPMAVVCASGYRSSTACSLLRRQGFEKVHNVAGGTTAWIAAGLPTEPR